MHFSARSTNTHATPYSAYLLAHSSHEAHVVEVVWEVGIRFSARGLLSTRVALAVDSASLRVVAAPELIFVLSHYATNTDVAILQDLGDAAPRVRGLHTSPQSME